MAPSPAAGNGGGITGSQTERAGVGVGGVSGWGGGGVYDSSEV